MINWLKGLFLHKDNDEHTGIPTYFGMSVTGYTCSKCGYKWYEKNKNKCSTHTQ